MRARAYGPEADIEADPVAMVRLAELEAAHLAGALTRADVAVAPPPQPVTEPSPHLARRRPVHSWLIAGAVVLVGVAVAVAEWSLEARPDMTLQPIPVDPHSDIIRVLNGQGMGVDVSTLRAFEPYHDVAVWSAVNSAGRVCFTVWDLVASGRFSSKCAPPGKEVSLTLSVDSEGGDGFGRWLPDGSSIDFRFHDDTVDVFVQPPP